MERPSAARKEARKKVTSSRRLRWDLASASSPVAARRIANSERKTAVAKTRRPIACRRRVLSTEASFLGRKNADARVAIMVH